VHQRAASALGVPLILTHGWPSSFLDYLDILPMLKDWTTVQFGIVLLVLRPWLGEKFFLQDDCVCLSSWVLMT
jgi:hypothetical protein